MTIFLKINEDEFIDEINHTLKKNTNIKKTLMKYTTQLGLGDIELIDSSKYQDNILLFYGWKQGTTKNIHILNDYYYGNIFVLLKSPDNKYIDLDISDYSIIYNQLDLSKQVIHECTDIYDFNDIILHKDISNY